MAGLSIKPEGSYVDATFGRGGHSRAILARLASSGRLLGLDRDPEAVAAGRELAAADPRFSIVHAPFSSLASCWRAFAGASRAQGILMDLGVSSPQLDQPERGFGFMRDGPLDMRMDSGNGAPASEWVNTAEERELAHVFWTYGEERHARRIAKRIVQAREQAPLMRTTQLADLIASVIGRREPGKHPATRCFQAIRIHINRELDELREALDQAVEILAPDGRLAVISFHSLEDRIVKRFMREQARGEQLPRNLPVREQPAAGRTLRLVGKAAHASESEVARNPRARSAVLRVAERLP
ncbi:16S rRNA (cytosine(1402)-N(4))-methyltransferase [Acidihalobacter prosperus]|uniref:Ribosomal RNA small subunit methyltransferase H n=1 Tax=Acidihalobacter prosperus TaxID=160660 RepID=A0A1A6C3E1_9GAMM|nr:16S rRNA (cytosine(1402)-N(4))-methyltransferase [Acidihalobacter prosperus]